MCSSLFACLGDLRYKKDQNKNSFKVLFLVVAGTLYWLTFAMVITGVQFLNIEIFEKANSNIRVYRDQALTMIVLFTIYLIIVNTMGLMVIFEPNWWCFQITRRKNATIAIYGVMTLILCGIPLLSIGNTIKGFDQIKQEDFQ